MSDVNTIANAKFVSGKPLVILIHGYTGHKDFSPNTEIRPGNHLHENIYYARIKSNTKFLLVATAYLNYTDMNVISVDYHPLAPEPCYIQAVHNLPVVARCTAQLLDYMISKQIFSLDNIHVIGFSLGAQTAGMVANFMETGKLKRVTGESRHVSLRFPNKY